MQPHHVLHLKQMKKTFNFNSRVIALVQLYFYEGVNGEKWKATQASQLLSLLAYFLV